ncbi:MAG TPA: hypothetical protein VFC53_02820 [Dehalococcoidia bacterium]|nr:hypothetical protein [Dehalococcoidia bacterium]
MEIWDIWYPGAGAQGLSFCRARIEPAQALMLHAAPDRLRVEVRDDAGNLLAFGDQLALEGPYFPMTRLRRQGARVIREDLWPTAEDIGRPVLLPGGEAGILEAWWNAADGSEWRWTVEFYNRR